MKNLPIQKKLKTLVIEMLLAMEIGDTETYFTGNTNFRSFRQTFYICTKELEGEWISKHDVETQLFTIVRFK